jgi:hypothetical protein
LLSRSLCLVFFLDLFLFIFMYLYILWR